MTLSCANGAVAAVAVVLAIVVFMLQVPLAYAGAADIPAAWAEAAAAGNMLVADAEPAKPTYMPMVGNGFVATVVGSNATFLSGVYNGRGRGDWSVGIYPSHGARLQSTNAFTVANGELVAAALDIKGASYHRLVQVGACLVEQTWYAHRARRELLVLELSSTAPADDVCCDVEFWENRGGAATDFALNATSEDGGSWVSLAGSTLVAEQAGGARFAVGGAFDAPLTAAPWSACGNASRRHLTVLRSSLDSDSPREDAAQQFLALANVSSAQLRAEHEAAWGDLWQAGVDIEGNLTLAAAVNASFYPILSGVREDWPFGISPGSLASRAYESHRFWDMDEMVEPSFTLLMPALARSMIQYRQERLEAARANAARLGYPGAAFPWESGDTGAEVCKAIELGDQEQHISADIVLSMRNMFYASGNVTWLREAAWDSAAAVCEFYAARFVPDPDSGNYTILDVYPPDESAGSVNSSVYTNVAAAQTLAFCLEAADVLGLGADSLPANWSEIAAAPLVPVLDGPEYFPGGRIHPEFAGYAGQLVNQADVALLQYPLGFDMPADVAVNDLTFYQANMPDSGYYTGNSAYSIAWLALGNRTSADEQLGLVFLHLGQPFNVWLERAYTDGNANFVTGAGGFLQNVVHGYGGARVQRDCLRLDGALPGMGVTRMTLRQMHWRGIPFHVSVSADGAQVRADAEGLFVEGSPVPTAEGEWLAVKEQPFCVSAQ